MADEQQEMDLQRKSGLFSVLSSGSCENANEKQTRPLFPSVFVCNNEEKESFDWLSNASYKVHDVPEVSSNVKEYEPTSSYSSNEEDLREDSADPTQSEHDRKRRRKEKSRKQKKHKHKKHKQQKSVDDEKLEKLPSTIWIEESGLEFEKAFRVHRKPDHENRTFGGLYRLDIALHDQNPKIKCLGLTKTQELEFERKFKRENKKKSAERYWENFVEFAEPLTGTSEKSGFGFSGNFSYVPLELPSVAADENKKSSAVENPLSELLLKTRKLNQTVRENPNDIQAWLSLADLQAKQVESGNPTIDSLNKAAVEKQKKSSRLSLEKKAAVLELAVEKNSSCVELIIAHMNVCSETMTNEQMLEKWRKILFTHPQKISLWKHYLMFCQSNFSAFSFSETLAVYTKCFSTLTAIQSGTFTSHSPEVDMEVGMIEIFVQFCQFLRQAGQTEKAIAAYQALIEFSCFSPVSLKEERSMAPLFETFWDSEVPRFGEENARGWSSWVEDGRKTSLDISVSELFPETGEEKSSAQEEILAKYSEKATTWLNLEISRDAERWFPGKTNDDDEDPDRIVLFQDISCVLFKISDENLKFQLLYYFLFFLRLPIVCGCNTQLQNLLQIFLEDEKELEFFENGSHASFACAWSSLKNRGLDATRRIFVRNIFKQSLEYFSDDHQVTLAISWLTFEKSVFSSETNPKERKQGYKAARKLAKSLLKLEQHRNNLRLWFAFVEIEWTYGNFEESKRIVLSLLEQSQSLKNEISNIRYYHFVRSYCELEMGFRNCSKREDSTLEDLKERILHIIHMLVTGSAATAVLNPAQVLKTHKVLQEKTALMLTEFQSWHCEEITPESKSFLVDFMICSAIFQYWSLGIDAANNVLDAMLSAVSQEEPRDGSMKFSGSKDHEDILIFNYKLLQFHGTNKVCPVKPLRDLLLSSLSTFPENAFFLHSFVTLELRSCLSTSARRYFDSVLFKSKSTFPWLFAILYEKQRQKVFQCVMHSPVQVTGRQEVQKPHPAAATTTVPQTGVLHRLRSLYERAVHHPNTRHSVVMWRSYMKCEAENGDLRQAKAIFYQTLQCCAWSKVIYLDAMKFFPELFQDIYDMMEEKELRIRTPIEEMELLLKTDIS